MIYPQIIPYKEWKEKLRNKIANLESLPGGLKCNYLVAIAGPSDTLIAKRWARKRPILETNEYLITF